MRSTRRASLALTLACAIAVAALVGCGATGRRPVTESRDLLGTVITVDAYPASSDIEGTKYDMDLAFAEMTAVEQVLSPYDQTSAISAFNFAPFTPRKLPAHALDILARVDALGVGDSFSPALFGVTELYDFGGKGSVPASDVLAASAYEASTFWVDEDGVGRFVPPAALSLMLPAEPANPGLDFGGANKGLALDRAAAHLTGTPALITAGSSTLAFGSKPDGEPWRVGIEDPREPGRVIAIVSAEGTLSVSTSGDYQTYFERDGVRYHHILDLATGKPARGLRSLTVFGRMSATDADILSTALFVMGRDKAFAYAEEHGIGIYLVDDAGVAGSSVPPGDVTIEIESDPKR